MVWFRAMSIKKISYAIFYGAFISIVEAYKKLRWFPSQAVETSAVKAGCSSLAIRRSYADRR
jgi:hypothetical protein